MRLCVHCHHPVANGDRHALNQCPPVKGRRGSRRRRNKKPSLDQLDSRGMPVKGTGKPSASSKGSGK